MKDSKLINYSTQDLSTESDMLITLHNWQDKKEKFLPKLKSKGLLRHAIMRVWNRDGSFRLGHIFEYKDENAYKNCQPIWQEIEKQDKSKVPMKIFANRGIVLEDNILV